MKDNIQDFTEKTLKSTALTEGRFINVNLDEVELPDGRTGQRFWMDHPGAAAIVVFRHHREETYLVRQYRYPVKKETIEIPAGKVDPGETFEEAAGRELLEECSFRGVLKPSLRYAPALGYSNEYLHIFMIDDPETTKGGEGPDDEWVDGLWYNRKEVLDLYREGRLDDSKTLIALFFYGFIRSEDFA